MGKFIVKQQDPSAYSKEIMLFWETYLPDTPNKRVFWMTENPDGQPLWYFGLHGDSGEIAGMISVMPKKLWINGEKTHAGIVGDFMISSKYRVFGPAMILQKTVIELVNQGRLDFLYTIPNDASVSICERAGMKKVADIYYYIKPLVLTKYLVRYFPNRLAALLSPALSILLRAMSLETYLKLNGEFIDISDIDNNFDNLWQELKRSEPSILSNRSSSYIKWHYIDNPLHDFKVIGYKNNLRDGLSGYAIYTRENNKMEIFDVIGLTKNIRQQLVKKLILTARSSGIESIYIRLAENNPLAKILRIFGFIKSPDSVPILAYGKDEVFFTQWPYVEGDRNI